MIKVIHGIQKYAHTQGYVMLRFFNTNQKNAIKRLEEFLNLKKKSAKSICRCKKNSLGRQKREMKL